MKMSNMNRLRWVALVGMATVVTGCGGGGGNKPSVSIARSARLGVYVTDGFREDYSQVFITLLKVELFNGTQFKTVFEDTTGKVINASALATVAQLLSSVSVPEGNYTQARITLGDHITLVSKAGGSGTTAPIDDSIGEHSSGKVAMTITTVTQVTAGGTSKLVVDFDLPAFELVGGRVRPHLREADDAQFQRDEKEAEIKGTITALSAQGFNLTLAGGQTITVSVPVSASIFSSKTSNVTPLANGETVEVKGSIDTTTQTVIADRIKVEDAGQENHGGQNQGDGQQTGPTMQAEGAVVSLDTGAKSFSLSLKEVEGFQPTGGVLTVITTAATVFERHGHGHDSSGTTDFTALTAGAKVEAFGTFDSATQTLMAQRIEIR